MKIEEHTIDDYECPEIILSEQEDNRIAILWKKGVIVKMLGKCIGYKALENKLNKRWEMSDILNIVDLGYVYYLVSFTSDEDRYSALMDGPWSDL